MQNRYASFSINLLLDGIGKAGDITDHNAIANTNPTHSERAVEMLFSNINNQIVANATGIIIYDANTGSFTGNIVAKKLPIPDYYIIQILTKGYKMVKAPGIAHVSSGLNKIPQSRLTAGDLNDDERIDIYDVNIIQNCMGVSSGVSSMRCSSRQSIVADLNDDGIVSSADLDLFHKENSVQIGE